MVPLDLLVTYEGGASFSNAIQALKFIGPLQGNADTATRLKTARTLTIGSTGKTFDGSSNVSWSLTEIGAAASGHKQAYTSSECTEYTSDEATMGITPAAVKKAFTIFEPKSHNHDSSYVKKSGDTMTGMLQFSGISTGNFTEGIRINKATDGWTSICLGGCFFWMLC